jgi:release factor glutamine methyltransferase
LFLLSYLLDRRRGQLLLQRADPVDAATAARFEEWLGRRASREPAQHISGEQEFYGLSFRVTRDVLIPRPETELLVQQAAGAAPHEGTVIDLGTGSGCIAVAIAHRRPDLKLHALDRSAAALEVARFNAARHGVGERIEFVEGDFAAPPAAWTGTADVVVSNPPYVNEATWAGLEPEVRDHDPRAALVPGPEGLEAYRAICPAAPGLLRPAGKLMLEIGAGQADEVRAIAGRSGLRVVACEADLNGIARVLVAERAP